MPLPQPDPMLRFIRAKIAKLEAQATKAQAEVQEAERKRGIDGLINKLEFRGGLRPHPVATYFMIQQQIATLSELASELELGAHLA